MRWIGMWKDSMEELKDVRVLACCGVLAALSIALKFVASIDIGEYIRIGFSDLPGMTASVLFGPAVGGIFFAVMDIIKYMLVPNGAFFPGFTLSALVNGILFGMVCYRKDITIARIFSVQLLSKLVVSIGLNTYWLTLLYGSAFFVILPARILTGLIMLPIDTMLTFSVLRLMDRLWKQSLRAAV
ncbi:MAG: folate family ECF transporter S component [Lachnospiraceae bacterium]|nr:folate family ECF transporter S component [Lachnospiraceae bacterium]